MSTNQNKKIPFTFPFRTIILANGEFPHHSEPLSFLKEANQIICCDGGAEAAVKNGIEPDYILGDIDSLPSELQKRYKTRLHVDKDCEINDLTKAVNFCLSKNWNEITILGATGKREDHSIGNVGLLGDYAERAKIQMITDYGVFVPILQTAQFQSFAGQQISIFCLTPETNFTFFGLKYPLTRQKISKLWQGTLNEAIGNEFSIEMDAGKALVFRNHFF